MLWILLILTLVWIALREIKPTGQRKVPKGAQTYWRSYIQTFVVQT